MKSLSFFSRLGVMALGFSLPVAAAGEALHAEQPLPDAVLDLQRGGFITDSMVIRIGLEQVVAANGETILVNRLNITDLNRLEGIGLDNLLSGTGSMPAVSDATQNLIESGDLSFSSRFADGGWLTVIQNRVDSTVIQSLQSLNIELDNVRAGPAVPDFPDHFLNPAGR